MNRRTFLSMMAAGATSVALVGGGLTNANAKKWLVRSRHSGQSQGKLDEIHRTVGFICEKLMEGPIPVAKSLLDRRPLGYITDVRRVKTAPSEITIEMEIESEHDLTGMHLGLAHGEHAESVPEMHTRFGKALLTS